MENFKLILRVNRYAHGLPIAGYIAGDLRYTTCTECEGYVKMVNETYGNYLEAQNNQDGMSSKCRAIAAQGVDFQVLNATCLNTDTDCGGICDAALWEAIDKDLDDDHLLQYNEVAMVCQ